MLFPADMHDVALARTMLCDAIAERASAETRIGTMTDSKERYLSRFHKRAHTCDAFTLAYLSQRAAFFTTAFLSHRRSTAMHNIYALPKYLVAAFALNGARYTRDEGDEATIGGAALALASGITLQTRVEHFVNDHISGLRAAKGNATPYTSGDTQTSSTLRALETLGIVKRDGRDGSCQRWNVVDANAIARLAEAARGIAAWDDASAFKKSDVTEDAIVAAEAETAIASDDAAAAHGTGSDTAKGRSKARAPRAKRASGSKAVA
jgi:hypothetical protein